MVHCYHCIFIVVSKLNMLPLDTKAKRVAADLQRGQQHALKKGAG